MKSIRSLFAAAVLAALCFGKPALAEEVGITPTEIKLGQVAALEGANSWLGKGMRTGLMAAFSEVNYTGGINGRKITLVSRDDSYDPDKAAASVKQVINDDKVFAVVGCVGTPTSNAIVPITEEANVPFVGALTGAKSLRDPKWKNVVNFRASYGQETEVWIQYLTKDLGLKKVAAFYQDDAFGQAGLSGVKAAMDKRSMTLVAEGGYPRGTKDIAAALDKIKAAQPEAVVMVAAYAPAAEFIREAKKAGVKAVFVNISFVGSDALAKELGPDAEGVLVTQVVPSYYDVGQPFIMKYLMAMRAYDKQEPFSFVSLEGYAVGRMVIEALEKAGTTLTRQSLMAALSSGDYDLNGLKLQFGNGRTQGSDAVFLTVIQKDGSFKTVALANK
ncbi:MAG: ABC transporter substrate-binding protein [Alphaproteobacteria bacterium]|nr:ABC transporter substrate-binding protein [Alphaproteobacteria bacterium]MBV8548898.1 ABC transporter substrate-binding protein [Alphaproteobacteria bacterium]